LHITDMEPEEFEKQVMNRRPVAPYQQRFPGGMPIADPPCVLVGSWLYGPFDRMNAVLGGWLLRGDHVRKIPVNLDDYETLVLPFRNIVFVEDQTYFQEWLEKLSNDGAPLGTPPEDVPVEKEVAVTSDEPFQVSD